MEYTVGRAACGAREIEYVRFGKGEKILVILPGLSVQSVIPAAIAIAKRYEIFARDFTVYLFERPADPPDKYTVRDMADDAIRAMDSLGLEKVCLFGASQGGMIAAVIAAERPGLVAGLALGSSACRLNGKGAAVIGEWAALAKEGKAEELYLSFGEKVYPPEVFEKYRRAFKKAAKSVTEKDLGRFVKLAEGSLGFDIRDRLGLIRCPVLAIGDCTDAVLGGEATLEIAEELKKRAPDSGGVEVYMYSSYGHAAYDTAPDFTRKLYEFFTRRC